MAEKSSVWRCALKKVTMLRTSSSKPRSTDQSVRLVQAEELAQVEVEALLVSMSFSRPGVATTVCTPAADRVHLLAHLDAADVQHRPQPRGRRRALGPMRAKVRGDVVGLARELARRAEVRPMGPSPSWIGMLLLLLQRQSSPSAA